MDPGQGASPPRRGTKIDPGGVDPQDRRHIVKAPHFFSGQRAVGRPRTTAEHRHECVEQTLPHASAGDRTLAFACCDLALVPFEPVDRQQRLPRAPVWQMETGRSEINPVDSPTR